MTNEWNQTRGPSPEQLAACTDGELQGGEREQVEAWLGKHPDAAAEVEGSRRLMRLWETTAPVFPPAASWETTFARIVASLPPAPRRLPHRPSGPWWRRASLGTVAAAVVLALLMRPLWDVDRAPFPVASSQDVTILSMDPGDAGSLVVGHPPILGNIDLANHGDVELISRVDPDIHLEDWTTPMIVDPQALVLDRNR
jgi:hypothetical protein